MLNVIKLATEVVLPLVSHFTAWANSYLFGATVDVFYEGLLGRKELSPGQVPYSFYWVNFGVGLVLFCVIAPLTLAVGIAQFAMLQASRMGFALTSPQKSAAMAYNAGKTFPVGPESVQDCYGCNRLCPEFGTVCCVVDHHSAFGIGCVDHGDPWHIDSDQLGSTIAFCVFFTGLALTIAGSHCGFCSAQ